MLEKADRRSKSCPAKATRSLGSGPKAWEWGSRTREYVLSALEDASCSIADAAEAVAGTEAADRKRFEPELASVLDATRAAKRAIERLR